ncbi:MAG: hypothetical protein DMF69_17385 [Acidobacteria bacterium]|nr:MAG: hypothetical protein DMF69_17385 [Acidobacteriota bacterium]
MSYPADTVIETFYKPGTRERDYEVMRWTDPVTGLRNQMSYYGKDSLTDYYNKHRERGNRKINRAIERKAAHQADWLMTSLKMEIIRNFLNSMMGHRQAHTK